MPNGSVMSRHRQRAPKHHLLEPNNVGRDLLVPQDVVFELRPPHERLAALLLERTILRGMRWAFGQSEQAVAQNRGAWVDAALTPFLAIADVRTRHPPL